MGLYAIVDVPHPQGVPAVAVTRAVLAERLEGGTLGAAVVQLRAKAMDTAERLEVLAAIAPLCVAARVPLIVDDDIEAALAGIEGVAGVHLGQGDPGADDVPGLRMRAAQAGRVPFTVGLSTHDVGQLRAAGRQGPSYVALGPIGPTRSKANPDPVVGFEGLLHGCRVAAAPLVAIGGLDEARGARAIELGATHVAVIAALVRPTEREIRERAVTLSSAFAAAAAPLSVHDVARLVPVLDEAVLRDIARLGDDVGLHIELGLPSRFRPIVDGDDVRYRRCDVLDLLHALDKRGGESWDAWRARSAAAHDAAPLVRLRRDR